jgi:Domain of unknown function (DUF4389)
VVLVSGSYPVAGEVACAERVARWRPLVNWALVIPLYLWLLVLGYGAAIVSLAGWFAILFTSQLPQRLGGYLVAVLRYQWRVEAFLFGLTTSYPGFPVTAGYVDPGDYPAVFYSARPARRRRLTVAFRAVLVIPQLVALYFASLAAFAALVIGWLAVLVTGRWPQGLRSLVVGWLRWVFRVSGYCYLLVDDYPPFGFRD